MDQFPRTQIGGVSVSRLVAGSNWWLGYAHQTKSRGQWVRSIQDRDKLAEMLAVFLTAGVNVTMGPMQDPLPDAIEQARQSVGAELHWICTPGFDLTESGPDWDSVARSYDRCAARGATFCWPHTSLTDRLYDGLTRTIRHMDRISEMARQRGMIPGLSTHLPEAIVAADRTELDVASYICIYNSAGFLMPLEIDWTQKMIHNARHPVTTIKPMAAGRVMPYVGLPFAWSTLRPIDLVTVGTMTPDEAREVIEISRACLEGRLADRELQFTRSKQLLT
ncbi:MAG: hypothetical protein BIFFINMI_01715 [Phycisphaerae bacterium]|nr:hypothetical protein [Phycisphaerae bacterium]